MNTRDEKQLKIKGYGFLLMLVVMAIGLVFNTGCGKKGDNNNRAGGVVTPTQPARPSCSGCPSSTALLATGLGRVYNLSGGVQFELGLTFYGDAASINQGQNDFFSVYSGTVVANGYLRILESYDPTPGFNTGTECVIPVGTYQVNPVSPGAWAYQSFSDIQMEATNGSNRIRFYLYNNYLTQSLPPVRGSDGNTYPYYIKQWMIIESVNNANCGVLGQFYLE